MSVQVISFNCHLRTKAGKTISHSTNKDVLTATEDTPLFLKGLSKHLVGLTKGEKRVINLPAEDAYGFYDPQKVILYPRKKLPRDIRVGSLIQLVGKSGKVRIYTALQILGELVSLDGNHPLAGQDLIFEIETLEVRDASDKELEELPNPLSKQVLH